MAISALGSALTIPEAALKKIKKADERLEKIQKAAEQTASSVKASFGAMNGSTQSLLSSLDQIIAKLGTIDSKTSKMSGAFSNLGAGKATQQVGQLGNVVMQAAASIDKMAASQRKSSASMDMSKSIADYQRLQEQINKTAQRQEYLTKFLRNEQVEATRISQGKGGYYHPIDVANAKEELSANNQLIASLRAKQQAIIANNQALGQQAQMLRALKSYKVDSGSLDNLRSKDTLAAMREYYKELEKLSAKQVKQAGKEATAMQKAAEKEAAAIKKKQEAWAKSTPAYGQQYHNERQAMYNQLFSTKNVTTSSALVDSSSAKTLRDHIAAVKELQQARLNLDTTDKNYRQNLASVNEAIKQHSKVLKEAGISARSLGEQTSYLAGYISRLAQRTMVVFSLSTMKSFIEQVAEVRGQFEISQRSLEAILQDKPKADEIFNKTVELAVKSPFRIKDLVDYTRQLSAYRIESDKLYDTTKRLADVSAGLGVDMGRLILAYGQVKAAAYLRGSEVRQFTEAGINMYGELQDYFKEVKGEAYTTAQIVDMISKRQVTFEDVEAIFQRMTDKGGTFYNMQEIQAETLQGKISNLHDAFDVMLNDIGKANEGTFKGLISGATEMLNSWETIATVAKLFLGVLASIYVTTKLTNGAWGQTAANIMASNGKLNVFKALMAALAGNTTNLGSAFAALGSTVMASLPLAALTAAIALVQELISVSREYNEAMSQNAKEYFTAQVRIDEIDAESKSDIQKALRDLVKEMNQKGFEIKIGVNLSEDEAKKQYAVFLTDYQNFLEEMLVIDNRYAKNKRKGWLMGDDDIETDMQEYSSSLGDFLAKGEEIRYILAQVSKESKNLTDSQREMFKQLAAGPQKGQSLIDYYSKVGDQLKELGYIRKNLFGNTEVRGGFLGGVNWGIGAENDIRLSDFAKSYATYIKNLEEVRREARNVFGDVSKYQSAASKKKLKILIDNEAIKRGWGDIEKDMLYKEYKINVGINKRRVKKEVDWIDDYLKGFWAKHGYTVSIKAALDDKAIDGLTDKRDQAVNAAKKWKDNLDILKAMAKEAKDGKVLYSSAIQKDFGEFFEFSNTKIGQKVPVNALIERAKQALKTAKQTAVKGFGVDPFEKDNKERNKQNVKQQRDLLQERISLLKDMNSKYDELLKTESKEAALSKTRKYFKEAAQNVGYNANDIMPDDKTVAKSIRELGAKYKELSKRGNAFRLSADLDLKVSEREYDKLKDDISRNIEDAFSGLELYKKFNGEGLSDTSIKGMFGDITTSFDELRDKIDDEFNKYIFKAYQTRYGDDFNKWSEATIKKYNAGIANTGQTIKTMFDPNSEVAKGYLSQTQKLNKQVYQDQVNQAQELIKAYKTQLSDQLQLDVWYLEEHKKLQENADIAKDSYLQNELQENLNAQYKKKSDENKWKDFQNSDMYVRLFDNLDQVPSKALDAMAEKLQGLRDSLKNLDPTELKTIAEQINKVNDVRNSRNPFKALSSSIKEMAASSKELKSLGGVDEYVRLNSQRGSFKGQLETRNKEVELIQQEYDKTEKAEGAESELAKKTKLRLSIARGIRDELKTQLELTDQQIEKLGSAMTAEELAKAKFEKSLDNTSSIVSSLHSAFDSLSTSFRESSQTISGAFSALEGGITAVKAYKKGDIAGMISGATGIISGIASIFSNENRINREIERQERAVTKLEAAYNKLKDAMDNAFDTERLYQYNKKAVETLEKEQKAYKSMISAERDRKKPDESKILSYQQKIDDLGSTIKELGENMTEALGGFGSQSNYKSAAEAFSEAWVDAFNEGSDALDALNDKFNDYIKNLVTKQATQRVVGKLIEPLLKEIDNALSEGSEGGNNGLELTKNELAKIKDLGGKTMQEVNDALTGLMGSLDYKAKSSSTLSNLQQGIQSVTESTAQALESILNSMRYYLATQQADVRVIRDTLIERLAVSASNASQDSSTSPVLVELRLQTTVLTEIRDTLSSCVKSGHKQGRNGIKVFMD